MVELLASPWVWLAAAALLAAGEIVAPGLFLIWLATAAVATGVLAFAAPPPLLLPIAFALFAPVAVLIGRRSIRRHPGPSADPALNRRGARLAGAIGTVEEAIAGGAGRVRLGDGVWAAHGPDLPVGARVRVAAVEGATLTIEPV